MKASSSVCSHQTAHHDCASAPGREGEAAKHSASAHVHGGYGKCSSPGCPCQGYDGGGENCTNCGHLFSEHWN